MTVTEKRDAKDRAALAAEWLLDHFNEDWAQEYALDVLSDYVSGLFTLAGMMDSRLRWHDRSRAERLAWAFTLTERRETLEPHEMKLLDLAWARVRDDAVQAEWDRLGGA